MIIYKDINVNNLKMIGHGSEGRILKLSYGKVMKDFRYYCHWDNSSEA